MEIKVVLILVAILCAAAAALFCDFLRTRNLQLSESMVEMKVRREEKERKGRRLIAASPGNRAPKPATTPPALRAPDLPEVPALADPRSAPPAERALVRESAPTKGDAPEPAISDTGSRRGRRRSIPPVVTEGEPKEEEAPKPALSDWLIQRAIARAAEKAAADSAAAGPDGHVSIQIPIGRGSLASEPPVEAEPAPVEAAPIPAEPEPLEVAASPVVVPEPEPRPAPSIPQLIEFVRRSGTVEERNAPAIAPLAPGLPGPAVPAEAKLVEPEPQRMQRMDPHQTKPMFEPPKMKEFAPAFEPVVVDESLWQSLFGKPEPFGTAASAQAIADVPEAEEPSAHAEELAELPAPVPVPSVEAPPAPKPVVVPIEPTFEFIPLDAILEEPVELMLPAGFQPAAALDELRKNPLPFTGLVISIGVSHADPRAPRNPEVVRAITEFLGGLMRPADFACSVDADELVLICPDETGIDAQRYLSFLSERLWDFQLRSLNTSSILFTLGAVDVQSEPLGDALASAKERMEQTMRSRRAIVIPTPNRRAV